MGRLTARLHSPTEVLPLLVRTSMALCGEAGAKVGCGGAVQLAAASGGRGAAERVCLPPIQRRSMDILKGLKRTSTARRPAGGETGARHWPAHAWTHLRTAALLEMV